jgi:hypothetical protein
MPTKKVFFKFFGLFLPVDTFSSVFKDKNSVRSHLTAEIKVIYFFACSYKDPDPYKIITDPAPGPKPTDPDPAPDPEHCTA